MEARESRGLVSGAVVTAVTQVLSMGLGAVIAVVILLRFGKNTQTDGLFAAYGVYGVISVVAQSFRTTVVPRLVESGSLHEGLDRFLGAIVVLFLIAGIPLAALGEPLAHLLTGDLGHAATGTAHNALFYLWLAGGGQLAAALLAAALGVEGRFVESGVAYVVGGLTSIGMLLALAPVADIDAVAMALVIGAAVTALLMLVPMFRLGYRPSATRMRPDRASVVGAAFLVWASLGAVANQLAYVVTIGFAARVGPGAATLYAYASFAMDLFITAVSGSMAIVLAAPLAETWDRRPRSLHGPMLDVFRAGLVVLAPIVALVALVGAPIAQVLLNAHDSAQLRDLLLALSGAMVGAIAAPVPLLATFAIGRYGRVAVIGVFGVAVQFVLCLAVAGLHDLTALGVVTSVSAVIATLALFVPLFRRGTVAAVALLGRELVVMGALTAAVFVPLGIVAANVPVGFGFVAAAAGLVVLTLLTRLFLPAYWGVVERLWRTAVRGRRASGAREQDVPGQPGPVRPG